MTRIEPPYLVVMVLLLVGASLAGTHVGLGHVAASLAYLHGAYYGTASPLNSVAWSLEIEVQFYLLVPALALLLCIGRRRMRRGRILLLAAAVALQAVGLVTAYTFLGSSIQFFLLGWLLADIYIEDWRESPATARIWDVVAVAALAALVIGLAEVGVRTEHALAPWVVFALGYASFRGTGTRRILSIPWIATIGGMCYSIYLVHYPLFVLMSRWLSPVAQLPSAAALFVASVVLVPVGAGGRRGVLRADRTSLHGSRLAGEAPRSAAGDARRRRDRRRSSDRAAGRRTGERLAGLIGGGEARTR